MIIILDNYGVSLDRKNKSFRISRNEQSRTISPHRVTAIHIRKPSNLSSSAILLAAEFNIPVLFFNSFGKPKARLWQTNYGSKAEIRHQQMKFCKEEAGMEWVKDCLRMKAEGQSALLNWMGNRLPSQKEMLDKTNKDIEALIKDLVEALGEVNIRSIEAQIGRKYWKAVFASIKSFQKVEKRTRQPAGDPFNALLNYGYGILYSEVETATLTVGLDPHLGILHAEEYNRPAFVFDAIEPFRPWVDRLVVELFLTRKVNSDWFEIKPQSVWLTRLGKKIYIPAFMEMINKRVLFNEKRIKRKDQIQYLLTSLVRDFCKENKTE